MTGPLAAALLDLVAPAILQMVDERLAQHLVVHEEAGRPDEWMTTAEAADYLSLTPPALRARVRRGTAPGHHDHGRWLFRRSELDAAIHRSINRQIACRGSSSIDGPSGVVAPPALAPKG